MKRSDVAAPEAASLGLPPPVAFVTPGVVTASEPPEAALAFALTNWARAAGPSGFLHVARSETRARRLARAASGFGPDLEILVLPP